MCTKDCLFYTTGGCHLTYTDAVIGKPCPIPEERDKELENIQKEEELELERYYHELEENERRHKEYVRWLIEENT